MSVVSIKPAQLAPKLMAQHKGMHRAMFVAAKKAAYRFKATLMAACDDEGITDTGMLKNSWKVSSDSKGSSVFSTAPHAGIIELGCRPHPVSKEGREAIAGWARRKLGLSEKEAESAAYAIALKIKREGQKPKYLVRKQLPKASKFFAQEFAKIAFNRSGQGTIE